MTKIIDCTFSIICIELYHTVFWGQICFPSSGLLLPKQISLHGDYLHCNALWLTSDGYSNQDISHALYARNKQWNKTEEPAGIAMLSYQHAASNKISTLLTKCDKKTHHLPVKKTTQGKIGLETRNVCCIPYRCGKVCVRQKGIYKPDARSTQGTFSCASQKIWL